MKFTLRLNEMMKKCLTFCFIAFSMCVLSFSTKATAQNTVPQQKVKTDYSDSQLKAFLDVNKKLQPLQQSTQQNMQKSIESSGLTLDRFKEIAKGQQEGKKDQLSADENTAFNKAAEEIMKQREKSDSQMVAVIQKEGMDIETFQGIAMAYQQSPEIQQKINKLIGLKDEKAEAPSK
ncbi:MAG TPA: DUF4168 domain-containing protein [Arachidicoccus sp.]|nr:DUF4168 domain-containing protein [Arachidicoccus sp.]